MKLVCLLAVSFLIAPDVRAQAKRCQLPAPAMERAAGAATPIQPEDLISLRDFGGVGLGNKPSPFDLSPDGRTIALQLRQADPASDSYCTSLVVVNTSGSGVATVLDDGGEIIPTTFARYGMSGLPLGIPKAPLIRWSPSGKLLAYIKYFPDRSEIWIYDRSTHAPVRRLISDVDIEELAWSEDGARLLYTSRPGLSATRSAIATEGHHGFHYDARFWPLSSDMPHPPGDVPIVSGALDPITGGAIPFRVADEPVLHPAMRWPPLTAVLTISGNRTAWAAPADKGIFTPNKLHIQTGAQSQPCSYAVCRGVTNLWWSTDGRTLIFQRRTGIADSRMQFFSWILGRRPPRLLLDTPDVVFGCKLAGDELVCAQESSTLPRRLIALSIRNGARRVIFDPNPGYAALQPGLVRRLEWTNAAGVATFGDLVLPAGYKPGKRLPLVIVQYESRGFLRGGTADEYPIQPLAANGFAVLSFNRTPWRTKADHAVDESEYLKLSMQDFADRRNILSSLDRIVHQLDGEGLIDPARVAITGQSDGAVTATFALANTKLFSAAILSTCCESQFGLEVAGDGLDQFYVDMGYPATREAGRDFWRVASLADATAAKPVPMLINAASSEFRMGLATYRDLKARGWPIEMYVYPDEGHVKLHPAHRLAIYHRNLQWLDFWLNGKEDHNPLDQDQYTSWKSLEVKFPKP